MARRVEQPAVEPVVEDVVEPVEPPAPDEAPEVEDQAVEQPASVPVAPAVEDDGYVKALLAERAELEAAGKADRVAQVDEQIGLRRAALADAAAAGETLDHQVAAAKRAAALEGRSNAADMIRALLVERHGYEVRGREGDDERIRQVDAELARLGHR